MDWICGTVGTQCRFTVYNSKCVSVQNMIIIDSVLNLGQSYADFATAQHDNTTELNHDNEWLGCISLNSEDSGFSLETDSTTAPTFKIENCIPGDTQREKTVLILMGIVSAAC